MLTISLILQASLTSRHSFMTGNLNGKNSTGNLESFVVGPSQSTNSVTKVSSNLTHMTNY